MSDRHTSISLPGVSGSGFADWGRQPASEMIFLIRSHAKHMQSRAEAILAAADNDFLIETYIGRYAKRNREIIQPGRVALSKARGETK